MLVGFIPVVSGQGTKIAQARLRLYQFCMSTLIQDLKTACGGLRFHAHFGTLSTACHLYVCSDRYSTVNRRRTGAGVSGVLPALARLRGRPPRDEDVLLSQGRHDEAAVQHVPRGTQEPA